MAGVLINGGLPWPRPTIPQLPGRAPQVRIPTLDGALAPLVAPGQDTVSMYVCGITPYDATHLGHAATYLIFDCLYRISLDSGLKVKFTENVTDVDDPLFERAHQTNTEWQQLAAEQTNLFIEDMQSLNVIPPDELVYASDSIDEVVRIVDSLMAGGHTYQVGPKLYLDVSSTNQLASTSRYETADLMRYAAERGGDPETKGKRNPLDPVIWVFTDEKPNWDAPFGRGRPGWHVECVAISEDKLGLPFDVQGGGADLAFPHHQMCASTAELWKGNDLARHYLHTGLVWLGNEKMSKSLGNLVFVSKLLQSGIDPREIRLALLGRQWQEDLHWRGELLDLAKRRLNLWQQAASTTGSGVADEVDFEYLHKVRGSLAEGLSLLKALALMDDWANAINSLPLNSESVKEQGSNSRAQLFGAAVDALLGVRL